jgi:hypothetical protein
VPRDPSYEESGGLLSRARGGAEVGFIKGPLKWQARCVAGRRRASAVRVRMFSCFTTSALASWTSALEIWHRSGTSV